MRVGACQTPEFLGELDAALSCIEDFTAQADTRRVQLLLFPECFLQGYLVNEPHLREHALDLSSARFAAVLERLAGVGPMLVFGVIEQRRGRYFNTAVVVAQGRLVGAYRKTHLAPGESLFNTGDTYPTFVLHAVRFGINICYDTQSPQAAAQVAAQDAQLLLVPAQNMMRRTAALHWKDRHHAIRTERVRETRMWLASADVTGTRDESRIAYGPTSVLNPNTEIVAQVPLNTTGIAVADVDTSARDPTPGPAVGPLCPSQ